MLVLYCWMGHTCIFSNRKNTWKIFRIFDAKYPQHETNTSHDAFQTLNDRNQVHAIFVENENTLFNLL